MPETVWSANKIKGSASKTTLYGSNNGDDMVPNGSSVLHGLKGNDIYESITSGISLVELPNEGIDTVYVTSNYVMPENVENLTIWYANNVYGNSLQNLITGSNGDETMDGGAGNDYLRGYGGNDVFQFSANSGYDVIAGFSKPGEGLDIARLAGYSQFTSFAQVRSAMSQVGSDVVLQLDANDAIKFLGKKVSDFTPAEFELGIDRSHLSLTFSDEFNSLSLWNGVSGSGSSGTWRTDYGWGATRDSLDSRQLDSESQIFIDPTMKGAGSKPIGISPFNVGGGAVTITVEPTPAALKSQLYGQEYISGMLSSRETFAQQYGYFEARIDIPTGSGLWPAFWLIPADGSWPPEIDILENYGSATSTVTAHSGTRAKEVQDGFSIWDPTIAEGYHTWGLEWTAQTLTWYLDDVALYSTATPVGMDKPMYMILDAAVAKGAQLGMTGEMTIDYVRAYQFGGSGGGVQPSGAGSGGSSDGSDSGSDGGGGSGGGGSVAGLNITGTAWDNNLVGTDGDDTISGLGGNDRITGGLGADTLSGGAGKDVFIFKSIEDFGSNGQIDQITDFSPAQGDRIRLHDIDADLTTSGDGKFKWIGTADFSHHARELHSEYIGGQTIISGDVDGDGIGDFSLALAGQLSLSASNFIL